MFQEKGERLHFRLLEKARRGGGGHVLDAMSFPVADAPDGDAIVDLQRDPERVVAGAEVRRRRGDAEGHFI